MEIFFEAEALTDFLNRIQVQAAVFIFVTAVRRAPFLEAQRQLRKRPRSKTAIHMI
jgi:hypothetical protein